MPIYLRCPYLSAEVVLTEERADHIAAGHPEFAHSLLSLLTDTLMAPHEIRRSTRLSTARLFSRWYDGFRGGKHVVVVVMNDTGSKRYWIVTAYLTGKLTSGEVEWVRS